MILRVLAILAAIVSCTACASGDDDRRDAPSTPAAVASDITCEASKRPESAVLWSCVVAPGTDPIVHGLSGIYYDKASSILWAASDDDETYPGDPARLLRFQLNGGASEGQRSALTVRGVLSLTRPGQAEGRGGQRTWQLEAIAPVIERGAWKGSFFVGTEHDALQPGLSSQIYRCTETGACEAAVVMPREFQAEAGRAKGLEDNLGIEGLTVSPDGGRLFAAIERPLAQEEPRPGGRERVRLIEYVNGSRTPDRQYAYELDPSLEGLDGPGVAEILARSAVQLLVLERSYARACGNTIRLFQVTLDPARALTASQSVAQAVPLTKQLLIDLTDEKDAFDQPKLSSSLENFEGMAFGPDLPDGSQTLLLVTDDNRRSDQVTALVSLRLSSLPTAAAQRWKDGDLPVCPR